MIISNRMPDSIRIEYDCRGKRAAKHFGCPFAARRFYAAKLRAGKNPQVKKGSMA